MKINRITIQDWHSFRDVDVDVSGIRVASVVGRQHDRPDKSNGAGKSFFLESVPYCLYGYDRTQDIQRLGATQDTFVEIHLEHRGEECRIKRGFKIKRDGKPGKAIMEFDRGGVPHEGKVPEIKAAIIEFVGCEKDVYLGTSFFTQGEADQFAKTVPAKRKEILSGLMGLLLYEIAKTIADAEGKSFVDGVAEQKRQREIEELASRAARDQLKEMDALGLPEQREAIDQLIQTLVALQNDYPMSRAGLDAFEAEIEPAIDAAREAAAARRGAVTRCDRARTALDEAQRSRATRHQQLAADFKSRVTKIGGLDHLLRMRKDIAEKLSESKAFLEATPAPDDSRWKTQRDEAIRDKATADAGISAHDTAIHRNDTAGPECPMCEQSIPAEHKTKMKAYHEEQKRKHEQELEAAEAKEAEADRYIKELGEVAKGREKHERAIIYNESMSESTEREIAEIESIQNEHGPANEAAKDEMAQYDRRIAAAQEELQASQEALTKAVKALDDAEQSEAIAKSSIDEEAKRALARLHAEVVSRTERERWERDRIDTKIRAHAEATARLDAHERRIQTIDEETRDTDMEVEVREWLSNAFSKNGIPMLVMENVVAEIEQGTVRILEALESPYRVNFRTQTVSGRDTILIDIETPEGTRELKSFSGGQVTELNLAIRLSLSEVLARRAEVSFDSVFLDEVMAALDEPGRQCFLRVVNLMKQSFRQVFVISHHSEIRDVLESCIVVTWHPDGSTVEVAH